MKINKHLFALLLLIISISARSQETPPAFGNNFKQLTTNQWFWHLPDSIPWQYKGADLGWSRIARYKEVAEKADLFKDNLFLGKNTFTQDIYYKYDATSIDQNPLSGKGILFNKNTDYGKIYFESNGSQTGDSNLIFENGNDISSQGGNTEGFLFRKWGFTESASTDLLRLNLSQFRYKTFDIYHQGNLPTLKTDLLVGMPNGVATLDANGNVPLSQVNASLIGAVNYRGSYNASTNVPAIQIPSSSNKGWYYIVSTPGNQFGIEFYKNDWIISNGTVWDKVDNNNLVTSVSGRTGAVTLTKSDVGLNLADNTSDLNKPISTVTQTALNGKWNLTGGNTATGNQVITTGSLSAQGLIFNSGVDWASLSTTGSKGGSLQTSGALTLIGRLNSNQATGYKTNIYASGVNTSDINIFAPSIPGDLAVFSQIPTNSDYVDRTTNQTIAGVKTITGSLNIANSAGITAITFPTAILNMGGFDYNVGSLSFRKKRTDGTLPEYVSSIEPATGLTNSSNRLPITSGNLMNDIDVGNLLNGYVTKANTETIPGQKTFTAFTNFTGLSATGNVTGSSIMATGNGLYNINSSSVYSQLSNTTSSITGKRIAGLNLNIANSDGSGGVFTGEIRRPDIAASYVWNLPASNGDFALTSNFSTGQTIGANTTGNSATATTATNWGGLTADFSTYATSAGAGIVYDNPTGKIKPTSPAVFNSWLGSPADGENLQSVTTRNSITPNVLYVTGNAGVIRPTVKALYMQQNSTGPGVIESYDFATSMPNSLAINPNGGKVGIGVLSPSVALEVNGNIITAPPTAPNHSATKGYVDAKVLTVSTTLDFPATPAGTSQNLQVTVTGAAVGDPVAIGGTTSGSGWFIIARVTGPNNVNVECHNYSSTNSIDVNSSVFKIKVFKD